MTPRERAATRKGAISAIRGCGPWPVTATIGEYLAAADRAAVEADRAIQVWQRWTRRFDPAPAALELGSGRVNVRHEVAKAFAQQRDETIRILIGPAAGSA